MGDLTKILAGTVDEVKTALAGKSHVDLHALLKEEAAGKNRSGVLTAIEAALTESDAAGTDGGDNGIAPADAIDTSGAPQQIVPDVDMAHPAVDADPRAGTSATQNRIDFNDPSVDGVDAVTEALARGTEG